MDYQKFIGQVLRASAEIANENFKHTKELLNSKDDNNQVLTSTDLAIGKLILKKITENYADHNIIDEEAGVVDNGSQFTWVVDPIDGTSNFANGVPTYGIMLGLLQGDQPVAGGICLPAFKEIYLGQKGIGASLNGRPIHVTTETQLLSSLVAYGIDGHQKDPQRTVSEALVLGKIILEIRNLRTSNSAYDMGQVLSGRYGAFLNQTSKIWDNVALQPIIEEAGGVMTDFWGQPMDYSDPLSKSKANYTICAGASRIHSQLQQIIHST